MPAPSTIPPQLLSRPFTVAEARAAGLTRDVLRSKRFWTPVRGVHVSTDLRVDHLLRCHAVSLVVTDAVVSHVSAAMLMRLPLPPDVVADRVEVTCARLPPRMRGVRGHVGEVGADVRALPCGVRMTSGARTWADLAGLLALDDLVVLGDALLSGGWSTLAGLSAMAQRPGRRGTRRLREALPLVEPRTDSRMETRLRLLVVRSGLPRPVAGRDVVVDGDWLARPDLSYPQLRIAIEYDGDHHRVDRRQWQRDIARRRLLEDAGWLLIVVTADDVLRHPQALVERIRRALDDRAA